MLNLFIIFPKEIPLSLQNFKYRGKNDKVYLLNKIKRSTTHNIRKKQK